MKVSIIVPVYKAEMYITECIESVLSQTYPDFELILIDDGSPDNSGNICDEYATKDNRIKVFHKKNGGVSSARNLGIDKSSGDLITFLDADDKLLPNCLDICVKKMAEDQLDMLQFWNNRSRLYKKNIYNQPLNTELFLQSRHNVCVGGGIYNSTLIKTNNIRFPQNLKFAEDQVFVLLCIIHARKLEIINQILYYYRLNPESATASYAKNADELYHTCYTLIGFKKKYPQTDLQIDNTLLSFIYYLIRYSHNNPRIISLYKDSDISHCNRVTNGCKILYYISLLSVKSAITIIRIYNRLK